MTRDGMVWLNQSQISDLFGTSVQNISYNMANILKEKEIDANSVIKDYLITASCAELIVAAVLSSCWGAVI